ncbi:M56 family metallopeptidase [Spongiimicrobium salis]|uniref:M56 family metallopeptidase n=1 Tax=Spongiimicrobium salis TaxID=1667022 RepID=UPI00374D216E
MWIYLLKFSACLLVFLICYTLFLEREKMHVFKRFYLLSAIFLSALAPLVVFTNYVEVPLQAASTSLIDVAPRGNSEVMMSESTGITTVKSSNYGLVLLGVVYSIGFLLFGYKFLRNLYHLLFKIRNNPKYKNKHTTHVLLPNETGAHTFFNYLFFPEKAYHKGNIPQEVFWHEETHARQKHSIDILFMELLQVVFWFHPLIYLFRNAIRLNHEFLADQAVLQKGMEPASYQATLLAFSTNTHQMHFASALNYSFIKKRFQLMKKHTSTRTILTRALFLIPVLGLTLYGFTSNKTIVREVPMENAVAAVLSPVQQTTKTVVNGATTAELATYERLVAKYSAKPYPQVPFITKLKEMSTVAQIFSKMTKAQINKATPYPQSPPSLSIIIDNDGNYMVDDEPKTITEIEAIINQFSKRELSNTYVFMSNKDYKRYRMKKGQIRALDDTYITIASENTKHKYGDLAPKLPKLKATYKIVTPALEDPIVKDYAINLAKLLEKKGVGHVAFK